MSQSAHLPPMYVTTTTNSTNAPADLEWSTVSAPDNWNATSQPFRGVEISSDWNFMPGEAITAEKMNRSFLRVTSQDFEAKLQPPKNLLQRMLWRALGVTWRDLRPERKMEELGKLK